MFRRFIKKLLTGILDEKIEKLLTGVLDEKIEKLLTGILDEKIEKALNVEEPKLKKLRIKEKGDKASIWQLMEIGIEEVSICITYIDSNGIDDFVAYNCGSLAELKGKIKNFSPRYATFTSVSIHVTPTGSRSAKIEHITDVCSNDEYSSVELPKLLDPIIEWLDEHPELLILI